MSFHYERNTNAVDCEFSQMAWFAFACLHTKYVAYYQTI